MLTEMCLAKRFDWTDSPLLPLCGSEVRGPRGRSASTIGVEQLQHGFMTLPLYVREGAEVAIDVAAIDAATAVRAPADVAALGG